MLSTSRSTNRAAIPLRPRVSSATTRCGAAAVAEPAIATTGSGSSNSAGWRWNAGQAPILTGTARFLPVRADDQRILTCFLEYGPSHVTVHDLLHEREAGGAWRLQTSAYRKLRLSPGWVAGR